MKTAKHDAAIEHPPHVHRLLRLIREGTPSHASRASVLLGRYAASCCAGVVGSTGENDAQGDDGMGGNHVAGFNNPSLTLWDLIGRLVGGDGNFNKKISTNVGGKGKKSNRPTSGLFDPNWATRSNCALALEYVARCLPLEDRRNFFEGDDDRSHVEEENALDDNTPLHSNVEEGSNDIMMWLNVHDLQKLSNNYYEKPGTKITEHHSTSSVNTNTPNHLNIVVEHGRLLLSSSGLRYDWNCNDEANEYIREQEALKNLDATSSQMAQDVADSKKNFYESFLMRRVKLQRQILARRLGLGGILSAPVLAEHSQMPEENTSSSGVKRRRIVDDIVADEDLTPRFASKSTKEKGLKRHKKGQRRGEQNNSESDQHIEEEKSPGVSIRALLVLESKRSAGSVHCRGSRHRNPQTLLGSELAYRTFDPDWTVRHGALLGTLSLLRAWKVHERSHISNNDKDNSKHHESQNKKKFGRWPQDILARCICILALDQFADFSGTACQVSDTSEKTDDIPSGAIVAPVREMAAQIIAILLEATSPEISYCTHGLLMQLYNRQNDEIDRRENNRWEIRHGVLLAWKYICAVALFYSRRKRQSQSPSLNKMANDIPRLRPLLTGTKSQTKAVLKGNGVARSNSIFNNVILQSIRGLSDTSDDNRAIAAQVLRYFLLIDDSLYTVDLAKECSKPLWKAIMTVREGVSSCAADLLHLLADLLSYHRMMGAFSFESIVHRLLDFMWDDSTHVKISCYCALHLVAEPVTKAILENVSTNQSGGNTFHVESVNDCSTTLCEVLVRLFETYFIPEYICQGDRASCTESRADDETATGALSTSRDHAWSSILDSLSMISRSNGRIDTDRRCRNVIDGTFNTLTLRFLGISTSASTSKDGAVNTTQFTRIIDTICTGEKATENTFRSKLASANALSQFYEKIYLKERPSILLDTIHSILKSPWLRHCEAGCLLHMSIASSAMLDSVRYDSHPFFIRYLPLITSLLERPPISVLLKENAAASVSLDDSNVQSICDNGLAMLFNSSPSCTSKDIVQVWERIFAKRGISFEDLRKAPKRSLTTASMRLSASISGAVVSCGSKHLPLKVTPLIRALMTSLKNEESHSRRVETCRSISKLATILSENPSHEKARNKLIENVCVVACKGHDNPSGPSRGGEYVIELLVESMSSTAKLEDICPVWDRLSLLSASSDEFCSDTTRKNLPDSILILGVISRAISKDSPSFKRVLDSFARPTVSFACTSDSELLRTQACTSIKNLCRTGFCASMDKVVPSLLPILSNLEDGRGRESGCKLLWSILHDFEVLASPYVTTFLPIAMRLMTDSIDECSRLAASIFAILVRIAPLAASHIDKGEGPLSTQSASDGVIRHLVLGKPLPPCVVPDVILSELQKSGITLRPYQMEGISWLNFLTGVHLNGALCDDMGLGKTLQALIAVAISHHDESGENGIPAALNACTSIKSLVVCPSSVVGHWVSEITRFFPSNEIFACFDFTGSAKKRRAAWHKRIHKSNIVVTSYSVLRNDLNLLEDVLWDWCVLDEGHLLKNPKTSTAKASRALKARHKLILTGTPIQNNVHEIWATFDFLMPNFLGTESSFLKEFAKPITKSQASDASATDINQGMESLKILHQQVLPFVLRREKSQVIKELPPKIITDVPCLLSKQQFVMYQQTLKKSGTTEALEIVESSLAGTKEQWDDGIDPPKFGGGVLASLLQLRLICTHPLLHSLFSSKNSNSPKALSANYLDIPLSFTRVDCSGKLSTLNDLLRNAGIAEPEITAADNDESGFLVDANENIADDSSGIGLLENDSIDSFGDSQVISPELATASSKCLIFAQFTQSLDIVERLLFEPHMPSLQYLRLDGRVPSNQRNSVVDHFNHDSNIKVLLLTTKVGGLGLNLTGADKVIFLEPDWNPFVDLQAMDRAHRIGQTKTVNVYRLITSDTIEEKIMKLQQRKKATSEAVVNADNSTMFSMGTDRLLDIFTCRGDRSAAAMSSVSAQRGEAGDDNVLSYLDSGTPDEYSSLSVDGFMRGL